MLYNENDPFAAQWLRNLIEAGELPKGFVDERSIEELGPEDCPETAHFFAGIGGWPLALDLAGWPSDAPCWTGSCPCQPFSAAGRRQGADDARHLWPTWFRLIEQCRPPVIFGEQVASGDGRAWLAGVRADLETLGYAVGAADLCAAGLAAPHIRQRIFWVGHPHEQGPQGRVVRPDQKPREKHSGASGATDGLVNANGPPRTRQRPICVSVEPEQEAGRSGDASPWAGTELIECADGKARRFEPGILPLAARVPGDVGRIRGYGNSIAPHLGALFVKCYMETLNEI